MLRVIIAFAVILLSSNAFASDQLLPSIVKNGTIEMPFIDGYAYFRDDPGLILMKPTIEDSGKIIVSPSAPMTKNKIREKYIGKAQGDINIENVSLSQPYLKVTMFNEKGLVYQIYFPKNGGIAIGYHGPISMADEHGSHILFFLESINK